MSKEKIFKVATVGGFRKSEVIQYINDMELKLEATVKDSKTEIAKLKKENLELRKQYKKVKAEKEELQRDMGEILLKKEELVKMELDAHQRATKIIDEANEDAKNIVELANLNVKSNAYKTESEAQKTCMECQKQLLKNITVNSLASEELVKGND